MQGTNDGVALFRLLITSIRTLAWWMWICSRRRGAPDVTITIAVIVARLKLEGARC